MFDRPADVREVHNYVRTLEHGLERLSSLPLSLRLIRELHERLMAGVAESIDPGELPQPELDRHTGMHVERCHLRPPPPVDMLETLDALEKVLPRRFVIAAADPPGADPLSVRGDPPLPRRQRPRRTPHAHPVAVRLGSAAPTVAYLSAYFEAHRQEYYASLLAVSQQGAWERWLRFFLQGVAQQSHDAVRRAGRLQALREQYRTRFQAVRTAARLLQVVDLLFSRPVVGVTQVALALDVSFQAAARRVTRWWQKACCERSPARHVDKLYGPTRSCKLSKRRSHRIHGK